MSLILKKIILNNIRSHKYICVEPHESGLTAISGVNGSGKSTIVDAVAWTLYGTKPQGVSRVISLARDGVVPGKKEKCFAIVEVQLEHSVMRVERRIVNRTAVECNVWVMNEDEDDFTHVAGAAVSHAELEIRKRLKFDEAGFLAAILVQQKSVDQLITADPKDRAEVIEKLTGISSITTALTEARKEYNSLKKMLQMSTLDAGALDTLKDEQVAIVEKVSKKTSSRNAQKEEFDRFEQLVKELQKKVDAEESNENAVAELNERIVESNATIKALESELVSITRMKDDKKRQLNSVSKVSDLSALDTQLSGLRKKLRANERSRAQIESGISSREKKVQKYSELIEKSSVKELDKAEAGLAKFEAKLHSLVKQRNDLANDKSAFQSNIKKILSAIRVITGSDGTCPTCLQHVDEPDVAVSALEAEKASLEQKIVDTDEQRTKNNSSISQCEEGVRKFNELIEGLESVETLQEEIEALISDKQDVDSEITVIEVEVAAVEKVYAIAKRFSDLNDEYNELLKNAVSVSDKIESLSGVRMRAENELAKREKASGGSLPTLRKKLTSASDKRNSALVAYSELKEDVSVISERAIFLAEKITKAEEDAKKYNELMKSVEIAGNTAETIDEFRQNRIRTSVPIVGAYASDLLNRFTDGEFTQFKLDEKFNATVTLPTGVERPVGLLSGGELSAAALALRLAISMLLNSGSSHSMLILDEVLVSQDFARSDQILATIKEVCQGQVLLISHGHNTKEIADNVIEL